MHLSTDIGRIKYRRNAILLTITVETNMADAEESIEAIRTTLEDMGVVITAWIEGDLAV